MRFCQELAELLPRPIRVGRIAPVAGNLLDRIAPLVGALPDPAEKGLLRPARSRLNDPKDKPLLHVVPYSVHIKAPFVGVVRLAARSAKV